MDYDRFIKSVEQRAQLPDKDRAITVVRATLATLAERVGGGEARHLASQLPRDIGQFLEMTPGTKGERFSYEEFCERVARREGSDANTASAHARAVTETLQEALTGGELGDLLAALPEQFLGLFVAQPGERIH